MPFPTFLRCCKYWKLIQVNKLWIYLLQWSRRGSRCFASFPWASVSLPAGNHLSSKSIPCRHSLQATGSRHRGSRGQLRGDGADTHVPPLLPGIHTSQGVGPNTLVTTRSAVNMIGVLYYFPIKTFSLILGFQCYSESLIDLFLTIDFPWFHVLQATSTGPLLG